MTWIFQLFVLENLQLLIVNGYIARGVTGNCGNAVNLFVLAWKKTRNFIDKASRGYNDLEGDSKSSQLIEVKQYLFICYKQTVFMQVRPNFM